MSENKAKTSDPTVFPSQMSLEATARIEVQSADVEADGKPKRPTFTINGYTGAPMQLSGFYSPVIVDLAGIKSSRERIPILLDHDTTRIIGQATATIDANGVRLAGTITGDDADSQKVVTHARNGFEWQASIGASIVRQEFLKAGEKATVNDREVSGPMLIARETSLKETSFVAIGADGATSANVAASNPPGTPTGATNVFEQWLQAKGFDPAALSDGMKATLKVAYDAEEAAKAKAAQAAAVQANGTQQTQANPALALSLEAIVKQQRDEDARVAEVTRLTAEAIHKRPALLDRFEAMAKAAIAAKSTVAEFELQVLRLRADAGPAVYSRSGTDSRMSQKVIEAALCKSGRLANVEKHYDARTLEAADTYFRRGIGLQELLMIGARENGWNGTSGRDVDPLLRAAFRPQDIQAEGFANVNIPGTLSNVMNKFLADFFNSVESAWRQVVAIRNAQDFKQIKTYSLSGDLTFEVVGPTGELKSGTVNETGYTNQLGTYGKILAITRQDIINDDLSALMRVPKRLGRGGALKMNEVIWTAFLAGVGSFWASGNANLISGATTNLSALSLTAALLKFRQQTDPDGKPLGLTPAVLLVPPEVEVTARQLMNSTFFVAGGSATTAQIPSTNTWQGAYQVAASTYLSNSNFTGYSTTAWWLLANPADIPSIELAVLDGREMPTIESAQAEFDTLGIMVRGYHDFGASLQEYRGSVRSAGA